MKLNDFIEAELRQRDMSIREFSTMVGLAPSTVSKYLSNPD